MQKRTSKPPTHRRQQKRRIWLWVVMLFVFIAAAVAGALFASSSLFDKNTNSQQKDNMLVAKDKTTVMIMGIDERDDDVGRSDTLMIATLDPKKHQAALLSIPRDTRVRIKGNGFDKINAAYAYGGHKLTQDTVENFLGTPMDHYVTINIQAFQRIIDAIGGIDIDVEKRMFYEDPWDDDGGLVINLYPGPQHMDGKTAITYVRYRDEEGDIGRIERQQKFMKALMEKVTSPSIILQLPSILREVLRSVKTDLSFRQLMELAGSLKEAQTNGLKTEMVPGRPLYIEGISYWIPDISKVRSTLADTLGITLSPSMRATMEREQREYESSIPSGATEIPAGDTSIGQKRISDKNSANKDSKTDKSGSRTTDANNSKTNSRPDSGPTAAPGASRPASDLPRPTAPTPGTSAAAGGKTM